MEVYNSLNPSTMVTPKKKKPRTRKAKGSISNTDSGTDSDMTRSSSSSSLEYINPTLLGRRPLYEQPHPAKAIYVYNNAFHPATSAEAARYGVVIPRMKPPSPPPRTTRKASGTKKASGTTRKTRKTRNVSRTTRRALTFIRIPRYKQN